MKKRYSSVSIHSLSSIKFILEIKMKKDYKKIKEVNRELKRYIEIRGIFKRLRNH